MTSHSIVGRLFLAAVTIFFLPGVLSAGAPPEQNAIRRVTSRFGFLNAGESPEGKEHFVVFDRQGDVARLIPLENRVARYGDGDVFALITPDRLANEQRVEVFRASGNLVSRFSIPLDRSLHVGNDVIVLRPNNDHGRGIPFDLEFLRLDGSRSNAIRYEGLVLFAWWMYPNDHWLVASVDRRGDTPRRAVHHVDSEGRLVWTFNLGDEIPNLSTLSSSADYAVIGTHPVAPVTDTYTEMFYLLDSSGSVIASDEIHHLQMVGFSPDERRVVLVQKHTIRILESAEGSAIWSSHRPADPTLLHALAFSPDGSRFHIIGQDVDRDSRPVHTWLTTYSIGRKNVTHSNRILNEIPAEPRLIVVGLEVSADGATKLITQRSGVYRFSP